MQSQSLQVQKANLYEVQSAGQELSSLEDGEVLMKIEKYALTTNNITYAVSGSKLRYWDFFPADDTWGIIPAWGFGEVIESKHPDVPVGERCYGYFPMSSHLKAKPIKVNEAGFRDGIAHRNPLPPIYNYYMRVNNNPAFHPSTEDFIPIIQPLFTTSFLIYHFLKEQSFFEAEQVVLTSASSKTGLALAFMLSQHKEVDGKKIVGLTSPSNVEFVKSVGYYDEVIEYDNYTTELAQEGTVIVDFAGKTQLLEDMGAQLADHLKHIALIGITDWKSTRGFRGVPKSEFFFAPTHLQNKYKEWGSQKANNLINQALGGFILDSKKLIEIAYVDDMDQLRSLYLEMLDGKVDPKMGYIVRPNLP